jgi:hypothetical protein
LSHLGSFRITQLHIAQVSSGLTLLLADNAEIQQLLTALENQLDSKPPRPDQMRLAIAELHSAALAALTVEDFRLGKAYGLGRALAETVLLPSDGPPEQQPARYREAFRAGRLGTLYEWTADLKTALPDHASYAVSWSLSQWEHWVDDAKDEELRGANALLRRQGQQWRALLSNERLGKDMLSTLDLVDAAEGLAARLGRTIGAYAERYKGLIALVTGAVLAIIGGVVAAAATTGNTKILWAGITALLAAAGGWRGISATLGKGIKTVEPDLWGSELDAAIAVRTLLLPKESIERPDADMDTMGLLPADRASHVKSHTDRPSPVPS